MSFIGMTGRLAFVAAIAGGLSPAALAQTPAPSSSSDEIVVTATRRDTNLQDTPLSVSALSGAQLEARGIESVGEVVQFIPGVALTNDQPGTNEFVIRGVATTPSNATLTTGVTNALTSVYLGQFPITSSVQKSPDFRFVDFARVEVLRGPQGTLYGQSAMGGVVRYIPNAPSTEAFAGGLQKSVSNTEDGGWNYGLEGHLNIPIGSEAALRLVGYGYENDGFIDVIGTSSEQDANKESTLGGRAAFRWTPTNRLTINLLALYSRTDLDSLQNISSTYPVDFNILTPAPVTPISGDRRVAQHVQPSNEEAYVFGADILYAFEGVDANLIVSRKGVESDSEFESIEFFGVTEAYFNPHTIAESDTNTVELRLSSNAEDARLEWTIGAYFEQTEGQTALLSVVSGDPLLLGGFGLVPGQTAQDFGRSLAFEELSYFGEVRINLSDALSINAGIRHAEVDNDYRIDYANGAVDNAAAVGLPQKSSESVDTYRVGFDVQLSEDALLYAGAASGYRPGGFNLGRPASILFPAEPDTTYTSDTLWNYELGLRTSWFDDRFILNFALFQINWEELQILTLDPVTFYVATRNIGEAEIKGVEIESRLQATDHLSFMATYARTNAVVAGDPANLGFAILEPGDRLPGTPENALSLLADWRAPFGGGEFSATTSYRFVGERVADIGNQALTMDSYQIFDARVGVAFENGLDLTLFVDNIADEVGVNQIILTAVPDFQYWTVNRPRTIGVSARYAF